MEQFHQYDEKMESAPKYQLPMDFSANGNLSLPDYSMHSQFNNSLQFSTGESSMVLHHKADGYD